MDMTPKTNHQRKTHHHYYPLQMRRVRIWMLYYFGQPWKGIHAQINLIWGKVPQPTYGKICWDVGCILGGANITINGMWGHRWTLVVRSYCGKHILWRILLVMAMSMTCNYNKRQIKTPSPLRPLDNTLYDILLEPQPFKILALESTLTHNYDAECD